MLRLSLLFVALGLMACGSSEGGSGADAGDPNAPDADPTAVDARPAGDFTELISRPFSIPAGQEIYRCTRLTVTEDIYIHGFRAMSPPGTHHTVLSVNTTPSAADGDYDCGAGDLEHSMLFASGVGTDDLVFPAGVAIKVAAGNQLSLNLHLYNTTDQSLTGTAGTLVTTLGAAEVENEAEVVFAGNMFFTLQASPPEQTVTGSCQFTTDQTVMTIWPHVHQLGTHMTVTHNGNVLHDKPFSFTEQINYNISPVLVRANESVNVECTYYNDRGVSVGFGDSSDNEMCFAGLYRYPATGAGLFSCVSFL